jgi:hypothetical protein
MTGPQPGPYPQYPGGGGMPVAAHKPPLPDTVQNAFYLMLAGAALQGIAILSALVQVGTIRDMIRDRVADRPDASTIDVDSLVTVSIVSIVVVGLIGVGLWLWMAFANRAGKNWARITATVFFAISTLSVVSGLAVRASDSTMSVGGSSNTAIGTVLNVVMWVVGLIAIILLYNKRSNAYFKPAASGYEYQPPGAASGYPATGPGPAPGQTAPPAESSSTGQAPPPGPPPSGGPEDMPPPR